MVDRWMWKDGSCFDCVCRRERGWIERDVKDRQYRILWE